MNTFVLFVDMLSFADLTVRHSDDVGSLVATYTSSQPSNALADDIWRSQQPPLARRFYGFHHCLHTAVNGVQKRGGAAIVFSDSAFLALSSPADTVRTAAQLIRSFIQARVPVRMGIASGSFRILRFLSDSSGQSTVHSSQFLGSAVVGAYQAESCGIKGLRILVHPDVVSDFAGNGSGSICSLRDTPSRLAVSHEINYLYRDDGSVPSNGVISARLP